MLQARFGSLVEEYETVAGSKPFALGAFPTPPKTLADWRAGVMSLMDDLAKFRRAKLMFERARSVLGMCFGLSLLAFVLAGLFYADVAQKDKDSATAGWQPLLFCGIAGAGFSVLSRLYGLKWSPRITAQIEDMQALKKGLVINCLLSVAEGAVAAGVIYLLFTSGLLKGDLFPEFETTGSWEKSIFKQFFASHPKSTTDVAKLLIWAFIAGFTERLVPDKLNRLAGEAAAGMRKNNRIPFGVTARIEARFEKAHLQMANLTPPSSRAFSGKLVPQDPKDEPAEKLLGRIQRSKKDKS
jgi:hypothetical protein